MDGATVAAAQLRWFTSVVVEGGPRLPLTPFLQREDNVPEPSTLELDAVNETLLELVRSVSALEAKVESMGVSLNTVQGEVSELKSMAAQAQGFSHAAKAMWTLIGLLLGAGGAEAAQALAAMGG